MGSQKDGDSRESRERVLFVTSEAYPLAKTGGLADVAGSLPRALVGLGRKVTLMMPNYACIEASGGSSKPAGKLTLGADGSAGPEVALRRSTLGPVEVLLVDSPDHFQREDLYGHPDDARRFLVFSVAAAAWALKVRPEVVHLNDWHAGPTAPLLRAGGFEGRIVITVHNLQYQGCFPSGALGPLEELWPQPGRALDADGQLNYLLSGMKAADMINTVSPTYAGEIQTPAYGEGLHDYLKANRHRLRGIINGLDQKVWDPSRDGDLPARFDACDLGGKARCKAALQRELGLEAEPGSLLLGSVGRITPQKGLDLVAKVADWFGDYQVQLVLLGTGWPEMETLVTEALEDLDNISLQIRYDEGLAHRIYAGADGLLMPSRFEPCGLSQLIGMRYGSLPIVRAVGGLADTVTEGVTGFLFREPTAKALRAVLDRTLAVWSTPEWARMVQAAMAHDSSWQASARQYLRLYEG